MNLYEILNFNKLLNYQTKHLVHFATVLKMQEKLLHKGCKKTAKPRNMQYGTIVIGTNSETICERTMFKNWSLQELHQNGMKVQWRERREFQVQP